MKNKPTKQHYVPQCYLREFATPDTINHKEPLIWIFPKNKRDGRIDKVKNVLFSKDLYTLKTGGSKDYSIETSLSDIEGKYTSVYRDKIQKRLPLNDDEHIVFCVFISALMQRTLRHKDALEGFLTEIITRMEEMDRIHHTKSKIVEDYRRLKTNSHKLNVLKLLPDLTNILVNMNLAFMCADNTSAEFITCDDPCTLFNPDLQWQKFYGYGLAQKAIELSITLSPNTMSIFSWQNLRGYIKTTSSRVEDRNRMVRHHSYRYYLSNSPKTKLIWFSKYPLDPTFFSRILRYKINEYMYKVRSLWKKIKL